MRVAREYRYEAAQKTGPQAGVLVIIMLIYAIITGIIGIGYQQTEVIEGIEVTTTVQPISFLMYFVAGQFALAFIYISKKLYLGNKIVVKDLFYGFKDFKRTFIANLLQDIYLTLWALLLIVPAIIKSYSYSMTYFLLEENKELSANEAITLSRKLMDGKKWRLFCLDFSYLGWILLSILTLGILLLWVEPRMQTARYLFFKEVYEEAGYAIEEENVFNSEDYVEDDFE